MSDDITDSIDAGIDRRGTVYGLYSISELIGVSPWYYMADSPPQRHSTIFANNMTVVQGAPSVKYRGFFVGASRNNCVPWLDG